jgi:hypothetical protein
MSKAGSKLTDSICFKWVQFLGIWARISDLKQALVVVVAPFVLGIIVEYSSFKGFCSYQLGQMIHPNLVVKRFTFIF